VCRCKKSRFTLMQSAKTACSLYKRVSRADIAPRTSAGKGGRQALRALRAECFSAESIIKG
jgi:hypothetical protein